MVAAAAEFVDEVIEDLTDATIVAVECGNSHEGGAEKRRQRQMGERNWRRWWRRRMHRAGVCVCVEVLVKGLRWRRQSSACLIYG